MELKLARTEEDLKFLYNTRTNPNVSKMLTGNPPLSYDAHLEYINKFQGKSRWVFIACHEYGHIGYSQIYNVEENSLEVGFVVHPDFQGWGLGKELVFSTINKAKELFPNRKIYLYVKDNNLKAIHIYLKLGFINKGYQNNIVYMELL